MTNKNLYWILAIENSIIMICLTALAIVLSKWWTVLFAFMFFSYPKATHKYYRTCDRCGKHSEYADSYNEALDKAKAAGWIHHVDGNKDYCPECKTKL